jgi:predicted amidophosphoribosyltransferase
LQGVLQVIYPYQCPGCRVLVQDQLHLCPECWREVFLYNAKARSMILAPKRKDRHDLVAPFAYWMLRRGAEIFPPAPLLIPIPLHWQRQWRQRFNQSALIAQKMARMAGIDCCLDGLKKCRRTLERKDHTAAEHRKLLHASMAVNPARAGCVSGREVVLVDDVFTSGATFSEAARASGGWSENCLCDGIGPRCETGLIWCAALRG